MGLSRIALAFVLALVPAGTPKPDWDRLARDLVVESNRVRRDPAGYTSFLEELLPQFEGTLLRRPERIPLRTDEGASAVREAIRALRKTPRMHTLAWSKGMAAAARDHVRDQGPTGGLAHRGRDGSMPAQRLSRYGRWHVSVAENIAYGENPAREVVLQLLIDDGVPDRGHRKNILESDFGVAGAACGSHAKYDQICVIEYAVRYSER
ncbi:MAG: CAP domain-containing protein [Gemmatimonadales bacterium]